MPPQLEALTICTTGLQLLLDPADKLAELPEIPIDRLRDRRIAVFTRGLNPELHDRLFAPVAAAGGELVQVPDLLDVREDGAAYPSGMIVAQLGWSAPLAARQTSRIKRPMRLAEELIALQLVRRREVPRRAAGRLWELARRKPGSVIKLGLHVGARLGSCCPRPSSGPCAWSPGLQSLDQRMFDSDPSAAPVHAIVTPDERCRALP